jgi:hypothetical protein
MNDVMDFVRHVLVYHSVAEALHCEICQKHGAQFCEFVRGA